MANRSAAHSWPLSGFIAIRWAVMSQQLLPSNHFGPSSGGEMTAGLWSDTSTEATFSVMLAGSSGGMGSDRFTSRVWDSFFGTCAPSTTTSSHTIPPWPGPSFVVGVWLPPKARIQCANSSPGSVNNVSSPDLTTNDVNVTSKPIVFTSSNSYARWIFPSVADTGTGAATTFASSGVALAAGAADVGAADVGGEEEDVVEDDDRADSVVEPPHPAHSTATPKSAIAFWPNDFMTLL